MNTVVEIPAEIVPPLQEKAAQSGKSLEKFVQDVLQREISAPTLAELLAPVHRDFDRSGLSEDALNDLIDEEREAIWNEKPG